MPRQGECFYSVPFLLLISGQDRMVDDDEFVELAKHCARACHVLSAATGRKGVDGLDGPAGKAFKSLERYAISVSPLCWSWS